MVKNERDTVEPRHRKVSHGGKIVGSHCDEHAAEYVCQERKTPFFYCAGCEMILFHKIRYLLF